MNQVEFSLLWHNHKKFRFFYLVYKNSADPHTKDRKTFSDTEFEKVQSRISKEQELLKMEKMLESDSIETFKMARQII